MTLMQNVLNIKFSPQVILECKVLGVISFNTLMPSVH